VTLHNNTTFPQGGVPNWLADLGHNSIYVSRAYRGSHAGLCCVEGVLLQVHTYHCKQTCRWCGTCHALLGKPPRTAATQTAHSTDSTVSAAAVKSKLHASAPAITCWPRLLLCDCHPHVVNCWRKRRQGVCVAKTVNHTQHSTYYARAHISPAYQLHPNL
jgi:hypothetical protein